MVITDGILDLFPKWEMSLWRNGEMVAYTFSINGLDWKCRIISDRYNWRSSEFAGAQPKITVFSKTAAKEWLCRFEGQP
jgi:hypothetical protein